MNDIFIIILVITLYFSPVFYQLFFVIKESKRGNKLPLKKVIQFLKYSLLILLIIIVGFGTISHTNYFDYEKPLTYDRIDQITFENFRGLEFLKKSLYGNKRFAYVVTTIESEIDDNSVTIQSYFHPSRSFVYNKHINSKDLLTHEMYHFKITELFSRLIKERISKLYVFSKDTVEKIIKLTKQQERFYQHKYDDDTFHSYVYSEQLKYQKRIDSLLYLYNKFKKPKTFINGKN